MPYNPRRRRMRKNMRKRVRYSKGFGRVPKRKPIRRYRLANRIPRGINPFPNSLQVHHKYVDNFTLPAAGGAGLPTYFQWRANSMYDPDYTGVGHQPLYYDEMAALYGTYTVLSATITIRVPAETTQRQNMILYLDDDINVPSTPSTLFETKKGAYYTVKHDKRNVPLTLKGFYDAAKWNKTTVAGIKADEDQQIAVGSNPPAGVVKYFNLYVAPVNSADTLSANIMAVEMHFTTLWRDPKDRTGS